MTREEAMRHLRAEGFVVRERNWALGDSICVCTGESTDSGITVYSAMEYIFPEEGGGWGLTNFMQAKPTHTLPSLEDAVAAITEVMRAAAARSSTKA